MSFARRIMLLTSVVVFATSIALAQKVQVDVDRSVNFSSFKTFDWAGGQVAKNPMISQMIMSSIEEELTKRGLRRSTESPDITIAVMAAVGIDLTGVGPTWNNTQYRYWGGYGNPSALMNVPSGTMLIDLVTAKDKISVFRGVAKSSLPQGPTANVEKDAKSVEGKVKKSVKKIFEKYPA